MKRLVTIYAATSNLGKLREFAQSTHGEEMSASGDGVSVLALPGIATMPEPVEDADTFAGNAALKAIAYSLLAPGLLVFADDSGLEVTALNGAPGVRSARFADDAGFEIGQGAKDERNNRCLLAQVSASGTPDRTARFVCALAVARDGRVLLRAEGEVRGEILPAPRGDAGFGYDPLFLLPELGLTAAELAPERKWTLSHRGHAFRALLVQLRKSSL